MKNIKEEFLAELESSIQSRRKLEMMHRISQVCLMVIIASCGFLTATASQTETKATWVSAPTSLLIFGLLSAVCAIINQVINPGEKYIYYRSVKLTLQYIRGAVKYEDMSVKVAEGLRALALTNPELVLGKLQDSKTTSVKL
jgi:hypothetical protein